MESGGGTHPSGDHQRTLGTSKGSLPSASVQDSTSPTHLNRTLQVSRLYFLKSWNCYGHVCINTTLWSWNQFYCETFFLYMVQPRVPALQMRRTTSHVVCTCWIRMETGTQRACLPRLGQRGVHRGSLSPQPFPPHWPGTQTPRKRHKTVSSRPIQVHANGFMDKVVAWRFRIAG